MFIDLISVSCLPFSNYFGRQRLYIKLVFSLFSTSMAHILNLRDDGTGHANAVKNTLIFNGFVLCQIFNELNARNPEEMNVFSGMTKNYLFMGIVGSVFVLQIINVQFLGKFTSTVKLDWNLWLVSLAMGIFSWPLAVVGKLIPVPKTPLAKVFIKPYQHCIATRNG